MKDSKTKTTTLSAMDIAKYVINKCTEEKHAISNLKLQNILYCLQRDHLNQYGKCLFEDDFLAWQFGPVIPSVYYLFCGAGASRITMKYNVSLDKNVTALIDPTIEALRDKPFWELVEEIHGPHMAWAMVYRNGQGNRKVIDKKLIQRYG